MGAASSTGQEGVVVEGTVGGGWREGFKVLVVVIDLTLLVILIDSFPPPLKHDASRSIEEEQGERKGRIRGTWYECMYRYACAEE